MHGRRGAERGDARVAFRQARGHALEHPRPAQVEAVEVGELGVGRVGDDPGLEPAGRAVLRQARQEAGEPARVLGRAPARAASGRPRRGRARGSPRRRARRRAGSRGRRRRSRGCARRRAPPSPRRPPRGPSRARGRGRRPSASARRSGWAASAWAASRGSSRPTAFSSGASAAAHPRASGESHSRSSAASCSSHARPYGRSKLTRPFPSR